MEEPTTYNVDTNTPDVTQELEDKPLGQKGESALKAEREENKRLKQELKELRQKQEQLATVDLEEYKQLKEAQEKAQNERLMNEKKFEELSKKLHSTVSELNNNIQQKEQAVSELRKQMAIAKYYYSMGGKEEIAEGTNQSAFEVLYERVLAPRIEMDEKGNITVLTKDGLSEDRREDGKPKTIQDLMAEVSEYKVWGTFFEKPEIKGGGITQGVARRGNKPLTIEDLMKDLGFSK